jgi:hypothetical protein
LGTGSGRSLTIDVDSSTFEASPRGIDYIIHNEASHALYVRRCTFRKMADCGVSGFQRYWTSGLEGYATENLFLDTEVGIKLENGYHGTQSSPFLISDSRFVRCSTGVELHPTADTSNSVSVLRSAFVECGTAMRAWSTSYSSGYLRLKFANNLATRCGQGLIVDIKGTAYNYCYLDMSSNWYELCDVAVARSSMQGSIASRGDRVYRCKQGMSFAGGDSILVESGLLCECGDASAPTIGALSFDTWGQVQCAGLTLADNYGVALQVKNASASSSISHCVFATSEPTIRRNLLQASIPATYCCFENQSVSGKGNLNLVNPKLSRPYYKLLTSSPCIDAGDPAASLAPTDYEGDARKTGAAPDMGADEWVPGGSVRAFGVPGLGTDGFIPLISSPNASRGLRPGDTLTIEVNGAVRALAAIPCLGWREGPVSLPRDLEWLRAPGSMLWLEVLQVGNPVVPDQTGWGSDSARVPLLASLVGTVVTYQWLVFRIGSGGFELVTSDGLRATIGTL